MLRESGSNYPSNACWLVWRAIGQGLGSCDKLHPVWTMAVAFSVTEKPTGYCALLNRGGGPVKHVLHDGRHGIGRMVFLSLGPLRTAKKCRYGKSLFRTITLTLHAMPVCQNPDFFRGLVQVLPGASCALMSESGPCFSVSEQLVGRIHRCVVTSKAAVSRTLNTVIHP